MQTLKEQQEKAWSLAPDEAKWIQQLRYSHESNLSWWTAFDSQRRIIKKLFNAPMNGWDCRDTLQSRKEFEEMQSSDNAESKAAIMKNEHKEDFVPEVGQECEAHYLHRNGVLKWGQCLVLFEFENGDYAIRAHNGELKYCDKFRPVQTPADKYREEQIEKMCQSMPSKPRADSISYEHKKIIASALYDKGCRILAPDEFVAKRLTDEQIEDVLTKFNFIRRSAVHNIIDAVQNAVLGGEK